MSYILGTVGKCALFVPLCLWVGLWPHASATWDICQFMYVHENEERKNFIVVIKELKWSENRFYNPCLCMSIWAQVLWSLIRTAISFSIWFIRFKCRESVFIPGLKDSSINFKSRFHKLNIALQRQNNMDVKLNKKRKVQNGDVNSNIKSERTVSK